MPGRARRPGPDIQPGKSVRKGETHLPGAENNVQAALTPRVAPARSKYVQAVPISDKAAGPGRNNQGIRAERPLCQ
jgi:hypothetical protein